MSYGTHKVSYGTIMSHINDKWHYVVYNNILQGLQPYFPGNNLYPKHFKLN